MDSAEISQTPKPVWWQKTPFLIFMLLSFGPLALPLLWFNPRYSTSQKLLWTLVTVIVTYYLVVTCMTTFKTAMQQARDLGLIQ